MTVAKAPRVLVSETLLLAVGAAEKFVLLLEADGAHEVTPGRQRHTGLARSLAVTHHALKRASS